MLADPVAGRVPGIAAVWHASCSSLRVGGGESELENRILLVEDDAPLRRSLEKFLERAGYAFESCATAREALVLAEKSRYGIVLAEYHLPDANGASLLERLVTITPEMAAIMISEFDFQAVAGDLVRANIQTYLKKPFDLVEVEVALSSARSKIPAAERIDWTQESYEKGVPASIAK